MITALGSPLVAFSQIIPSNASIQRGMDIAKRSLQKVVPFSFAFDLYLGNRIFSLGSWSLLSAVGLLALHMPQLIKKGEAAVQDWLFEKIKLALVTGNVFIFHKLLPFLDNVNRADKNGNTLLHHLCTNPPWHMDTVQALKKRGADPFTKNKKGEMALHHAQASFEFYLVFFDCHGQDFNKCKNLSDFNALLFPPYRNELPPYFAITKEKLGRSDRLVKFKEDLAAFVKQNGVGVDFATLLQLVTKREQLKKDALSVTTWSGIILTHSSLLKFLYHYANKPTITEIDYTGHPHFNHCRGAQYDALTHQISIGMGGEYLLKFSSLVFEIFNAISRELLLRIHDLENSGEIHPEERILLNEWVEYKSYCWRHDILKKLGCITPKPESFEKCWKQANSSIEGRASHADMYRTKRYPLAFFARNLWFLKERVAEINAQG